MREYKNYVESGVEWLGVFPNHWKSTKLKWIAHIYAGGTPSTNIDEYWENGSIPWLNSGTVNQKRITMASEYITEDAVLNSSTKWVPKGSLLMALAGQGKTKGMVAILEFDATCNQSMAAIVPNLEKINNEYLFYWLDYNYSRIRGLAGTELRDGLNLEIIGDIYCPVPPLEEQKKISEYLKSQTNLVDSIIRQKEELIDLIQEKKRSIINEVVTKGLDWNATLKYSEIESLGKIPEDWNMKPLKYLASLKGRLGWKGLKADEYVEAGYGFLSTPDIKNETIDFNTINFITEERYLESPEIILEVGDLLLVKDGSTLGIVNIIKELPIPSTVNSSIGIIRVFDTSVLSPEYLFWLLKSDYMQTEINKLKAGQGVPHLFQKDIKNLIIVLPPLDLQDQIVAYIDNKNALLSAVLAGVNEQITKLKEFKISITSEAVSGKVNVSDWYPSE
jgi:type I restriction enzyme S subunit